MSIRKGIIGKLEKLKGKVQNHEPLTEADLEAANLLADPRNFQPEPPSSPKSSYDEAHARIEELQRKNDKWAAQYAANQRAMLDIVYNPKQDEKAGERSNNNLAAYKDMEKRAEQNKRDRKFLAQQNLGDDTQRGAPANGMISELLGKAVQQEQKKAPARPQNSAPTSTIKTSQLNSTSSRPITTPPKRSGSNFSYKSTPSTVPNVSERAFNDMMANLLRKQGIGVTNPEVQEPVSTTSQETISEADIEAARMLADWTNVSRRRH